MRAAPASVHESVRKFSRRLLGGLGIVFMLIALCVFIRPAALSANQGLSYFGDFWATFVPYTAAFVLYAYFLWRIADVIHAGRLDNRRLAGSFRMMSVLLIGLVLTPSDLIGGMHKLFGILFFSLQLIISIWIAGWLVRDRSSLFLVFVEFASGLVAFYYLPKATGLLLQAETLFQLAFGLLLCKLIAANEHGLKYVKAAGFTVRHDH